MGQLYPLPIVLLQLGKFAGFTDDSSIVGRITDDTETLWCRVENFLDPAVSRPVETLALRRTTMINSGYRIIAMTNSTASWNLGVTVIDEYYTYITCLYECTFYIYTSRFFLHIAYLCEYCPVICTQSTSVQYITFLFYCT